MKNAILGGFLAVAATGLVGCGSQVGTSLRQAVETNQKATSLIEWESSDSHPEAIFQKIREDIAADSSQSTKLQAEVCQELGNLDSQSLTLFEEEIDSKENASILANCKTELKQKLDSHYVEQRQLLDVPVDVLAAGSSGNNFKFQPNVQKRDLSNGYFAVSGDVSKKEVIITFDDGPSGQYTDSILKSLKEVDAKAIFFALGKNVRANPAALKRVAADGHAVGSHSVTHACLGSSRACDKTNGRKLSFDEAVAEIKGGHQAVYDALGFVDPFFRFPYGEASPELKQFLKRSQVGEFFWAIDSEDWKAQSNETLLKNTMQRLNARGRGILLFHDIQRKTAEIMPQLLRELYTSGYSIVLLQASDSQARYNSKLVRTKLP